MVQVNNTASPPMPERNGKPRVLRTIASRGNASSTALIFYTLFTHSKGCGCNKFHLGNILRSREKLLRVTGIPASDAGPGMEEFAIDGVCFPHMALDYYYGW